MVMSAMREKTKVVLFMVLLAFVGLVFFDWGMQGGGGGNRGASPGAIGRVNGKDITYDEYMRTRQQLVAAFERRSGNAPQTADYDAIEEETWATLVREKLFQQEIEKWNITTSDPEIVEIIRNNPPEFVLSSPVFQNESGQFDPARYQQALADPNFDWRPVEEYLKASLPASKLENYVALNARVTRGEVRARFLDENEKVRARFVKADAANAATEIPSVDEAAARAWYEAHPDDFRAGERAVLEIVRFPKSATPEDSAFVREELEDVRRMVVEEGKDFAELAKTWSEDPSGERGGDLGFFQRGDMVPEFEKAAFALAPGEVSPVFLSPFGYHIVRLEEKKTEGGQEQIRARHMLMKVEPSNASVRAQEQAVEAFLAAAESGKTSFADVATAQGLTVDRTPPFERTSFVPGVGSPRLASRFAFSAEVGSVRPEPLEDERAFLVVRLAERTPAGVRPFEEARAEAERLALDAKRKEHVRAKLEAAASGGAASLDAIAKAMGGKVDSTGAISRSSFVPGVGRKNAFVAAAFALPPGQISGVIDTDTGCAVLEVAEKIPADESMLAAQEQQLRQQLLMEKRRNLVTSWLEGLLAEAEIVDLRGGDVVPWKPDPSMFRYLRTAEA
jgi:parvulin-like peptidyl-prolyl isomerase